MQLKKRNVLLMILLTLITYGVYIPVWFLNRKDSINNLNSKEKISAGPIIFLLIISIIYAIMLIPSILFTETSIGSIIDWIDIIINLAGSIIILIMSFKVRRILNEHYNTKISDIATFLFTFFYLQYKINRFNEIVYEPEKTWDCPKCSKLNPNTTYRCLYCGYKLV
jgi:hypothetical protein